MKISPNDPCPCFSGLKYKKCCRIFHGGTPAPTPEKLMRSRYSAYALNKSDYIMRTTHPQSPHFNENRAKWITDVESFSLNTRFAGLEILSAEEDHVTFKAILFQGDHDVSYVEKSLFRQHDGHWLYVQADNLK